MDQLKPDEALAQISYLREIIEETKERAAYGWSFYVLWGTAWTIGYIGAAVPSAPPGVLPRVSTHFAYYVWFAVIAAASIGSVILGRRRAGGRSTRLGRQLGRINLIVIVAIAVFSLALPSMTHLILAYWPFWFGVLYLVNGVLLGRELLVLGGWLIGAAIVSLAMPVWVQAIFLAPCGGGALIVTGALFRRQLRAS